jgi:ATP-binding protein involved in chromosome partitioning
MAERPFPVNVITEPAPAGDATTPGPAPIPGVADVVLVGSGKGGVGKSTVTANLACALQRLGCKVGVVDADLYGPSMARMLGSGSEVNLDDAGRVVPASGYDIPTLSIGNVLPPEASLAWKGPLVTQALEQMFHGTAWPQLDLLLVDLPPGTGDVLLTLLDTVPISGVVLVSTPQQVALDDAERLLGLFHAHDVPVFGMVENMAHFTCPCCGERQAPYGVGKVRGLTARRHIAHLGELPLDPYGQSNHDADQPLLLAHPHGEFAEAMHGIARGVDKALKIERRLRSAAVDARQRDEQEAMWAELLE